MDIHSVTVLVQYNIPGDLPTLSQRFGRAAHDPSLKAVCVLLAPSGYFYAEQEKHCNESEKRAAKCQKTGKGGIQKSGVAVATLALPAAPLHPPFGLDAHQIEGLEDNEDTSSETSLDLEEDHDLLAKTMPVSTGDGGKCEEYIPAPGTTGGKRKRNATTCERFATTEGLDAFINADHLPTGNKRHGCRRKVEQMFYGNDQICELFVGWQIVLSFNHT